MLNPEYSQNLLTPLITRSQARYSAIPSPFLDEAAEFLVEQLDLENLNCRAQLSQKQLFSLIRSHWIDQQLIHFFDENPNAMGIEIGSGLNTRFQRLSRRLAWPQFSWVDLDTPEAAAFNNGLLPITDNYRMKACDFDQENWLQKAGWKTDLDLIVVIENRNVLSHRAQLKTLFSFLNEEDWQTERNIHLVMDCCAPTFSRWHPSDTPGSAKSAQDVLHHLPLPATIIVEQDLSLAPSALWKVAGHVYKRLAGAALWSGLHLKLTPNTSMF